MSVQEQEQERVWFAREVFNLFVKAFTNLKLYPHHHAHVTSALDEFSKRLKSYTKLHDVLRIGVTQDTLVVEDQTVYESENLRENLAFRLYVDGLREISITKGVTTEEAHGLAKVFYSTIVDQDADSTLLLWEADFANINHVAINALTDAWESPDYFSSDQLDLLKNMNNDVDAIVETLTQNAGRGTYQFELTDSGTELDTASQFEDDTDAPEEKDDIFDVQQEAIGAFRDDALSWGPDRLLKQMVEHALDGLALQQAAIGRSNVGWLLTESTQMALRSHDLNLLSDLLNRYDGELQLLEDEDTDLFDRVFKWLGREENLERVVLLARGGAVGGPRAYVRICEMMGETGMLAAVSAYLESDSKELKTALTTFMQDNAMRCPEALKPMFDKHRSAETVKTAMFIVNKSVKGPWLGKLLKLVREHEDPELKRYAEHLWRTNTGEGRVNVLIDALNAEDRKDRVRALQSLVKNKQRGAAEKLKQIIQSAEFLARDIHERQAYIDALRYLGGTSAVGFLEHQTKRSTMLFNRKAAKEVRELARKALEDLRTGRR